MVHFNTYSSYLFDFSTGYGGGGGGGGVVVMEASSSVQLDGSTTIEVDEGAGGAGDSYSGRFGNAGSDGALLIVSNINFITDMEMMMMMILSYSLLALLVMLTSFGYRYVTSLLILLLLYR